MCNLLKSLINLHKSVHAQENFSYILQRCVEKSLYNLHLRSINLYILLWNAMTQYNTFFYHEMTFLPI